MKFYVIRYILKSTKSFNLIRSDVKSQGPGVCFQFSKVCGLISMCRSIWLISVVLRVCEQNE